MTKVNDLGRTSDWSGVRVVVAGFGVSGYAAADNLTFLGARVIALDESEAGDRRRAGRPAREPRCHHPARPRLDRDPARRRRPRGDLPRLGALVAAARPGGGLDIPIWGEVELAWRLRDPSPAGSVARRHRHERQDHHRADARGDAPGRRPAHGRVRKRRAADRRGRDGPRALGRPGGRAVQLPAALHVLDAAGVGRGAQRRRGPPRLVPRGQPWTPTPRTRAGSTRACSAPASTTWPTRSPSSWSGTPTSRRARGRSGSRWAHPAVGMLGVVDDVLADRAFIEDRQTDGGGAVHARRPGQRPLRTTSPTRWPPPRWPARTASPPARSSRPCAPSGRTATGSPRSRWSTASPGSTTPRRPTRTRRWPRCAPTTRWSGSRAASPRAPRSTTWSSRCATGCGASCSWGRTPL